VTEPVAPEVVTLPDKCPKCDAPLRKSRELGRQGITYDELWECRNRHSYRLIYTPTMLIEVVDK